MTFRLPIGIPAIALIASATHAQTLTYAWPALGMDPCLEWLNCEGGCSACNAPASSSAALIGTAAAFIGVDACAHPVTGGDNAVHTPGWGQMVGDQRVIIGLISLVPLHIDSIIVRHASAADGPTRLLIEYARVGPITENMEADAAIHDYFENDVLTNAGVLKAEGDQPFGMGQIILKAYGGGTGSWLLDEVRIVTSPEIHTGISVNEAAVRPNGRALRVDQLGRQLNTSAPGPGMIVRSGSISFTVAP